MRYSGVLHTLTVPHTLEKDYIWKLGVAESGYELERV
jgi:hypothetical protein